MNFCAHLKILKVRSTSGSADCSLYFLSQPAVMWSSRGWFFWASQTLEPLPTRELHSTKAPGVVSSLKTFGERQMSGPMVLIHTKPIGAQKCCKGPQVEDFLMASSEEPLFLAQQRTRSGLTLLQMSLSTKVQNQMQHSFDIPITVVPKRN